MEDERPELIYAQVALTLPELEAAVDWLEFHRPGASEPPLDADLVASATAKLRKDLEDRKRGR